MQAKIGNKARFIKNLQENAGEFEFYQIVRLIHRYLSTELGMLEFHVDPKFAFPVNELAKLEVKEDDEQGKRFSLFVTFIGLVGQSGVLPEHYTELLLERLHEKDTTFLALLDIFHNQLLKLFYEIGTASHYYIADEIKQPHKITKTLDALIGQSEKKLPEILRYYAGVFSQQSRSAEGLTLLLQYYFELPISIVQYTPKWINLDSNDMTKLSVSHHYLGKEVILGKRVWHVQNKLSILIGPLTYKQFKCLLPDGKSLSIVEYLIKVYLGIEYDYNIKLLLKSSSIPECRLKKDKKMKLGWTTWLKAKRKNGSHVVVALG